MAAGAPRPAAAPVKREEAALLEQAPAPALTLKPHIISGRPQSRTKNIVYKGMVLLIEDDGHSWRKYGQKELKESIVRHYFKCKDKNCQARKCLDQTLTHPIKTEMTYVGEHTCSPCD
jgi:hypothetical protein